VLITVLLQISVGNGGVYLIACVIACGKYFASFPEIAQYPVHPSTADM